jgi:hypothetical protein
MHNFSASFRAIMAVIVRAVGGSCAMNFSVLARMRTIGLARIYFWEANPDRALDWAKQRSRRMKLKESIVVEPFVVGTIIDLGFCLDLLSTGQRQVSGRSRALVGEAEIG